MAQVCHFYQPTKIIMSNNWKNQISLTGKVIRLEPLAVSHIHDLSIAGNDLSIWEYMLYGKPITFDAMDKWVHEMIKRGKSGDELPFAVIIQDNGKAIGSTRYLDMREEHKNVEIGGTWYARDYQGTLVNIECKYLLLKYAFEQLGCIRVQLKTDMRNIRSQKAIEKLGAIKEGTLRNHMITPEGIIRHSVFYSILDSEWDDVKNRLETKLLGK